MKKLFDRKITSRKDAIFIMGFLAVILLLVNILSQFAYFRWDLTAEKKYSITTPTKNLLKKLPNTILVKVYLDGDMPSGFKKLREATRDILNEFRAYGGTKIEYQFIDPVTGKSKEEQKAIFDELLEKGLAPYNVQTGKQNESKVTMLFPSAVVSLGENEYPVSLVENQIGYSKEEVINNSVISLEYKFANAIQKLTQYQAPRVAFVSGHDELNKMQLADIQQTLLSNKYEISNLDITKSYKIPKELDAIVIAKPKQAFDEKDKYKIDQYIMHGGHVLWLIDATTAEMDSLQLQRGVQNVFDRNLNLEDMFFKYGVRFNTDLIQDITMFNMIPIVVGQMGNAPQTELFPWYYFPLLSSQNNHAIVKNIDPVAGKFVGTIDTIRSPGLNKTILLTTSDLSKAIMTPMRVHFGILQQKPNPEYYKQPKLPAAVLVEGKFTSLYKNRLSPEYLAIGDTVAELKFIEESPESKQIFIADGDIIQNDMKDSSAYPLGFYRFTNQTFANKDFVLNCIQYLVDNSGLLTTRNKDVKLRLLNSVRVQNEKTKWQIINILLPIIFVVIGGFLFISYRKKKYTLLPTSEKK